MPFAFCISVSQSAAPAVILNAKFDASRGQFAKMLRLLRSSGTPEKDTRIEFGQAFIYTIITSEC